MLAEKDSAYTVPFRVFLSNGTAPDTGLSNDSLRGSSLGAAQFTCTNKISAVSANAGMYAVMLATSETSVLGTLALWYDQGDFPQHVATVEVVNSNPYSNWSNIAAKTYSGVTVGSLATLVPTDYSSVVTVGVGNIIKTVGAISGLSFAPVPGDYGSTVTVGVDNIAKAVGATSGLSFLPAPGTYSAVSVSVAAMDKAVGATSGLSFAPVPGDYSSTVTVGVSKIKAGTYSGVTVGSIATLLGGDYSNVTISGLDSGVTVATGGIVAASFGAGAVDATALASSGENAIADALLARNIAGGSSAGRIVSEALYALRNKVAIDGSTVTVYRVDDSTSAWTASVATASVNSGLIQSVDPA